MKEIYYLNKSEYPVIPTPHDCVIKEIRLEPHALVFVFEENMFEHDAIKYQRPGARSLIMTFHLDDPVYDVYFLQRKCPVLQRLIHRPFNRLHIYQEIDLSKSTKKLTELPSSKLEYLTHYVAYCSIIVELYTTDMIQLQITAKSVELEWIY